MTRWFGSLSAIIASWVFIGGWLVYGGIYGFSDQLYVVVNTTTTVVTFLMVFLLQRTQNHDTLAIQLKLNEVIRALDAADNARIALEQAPGEKLAHLEQADADQH